MNNFMSEFYNLNNFNKTEINSKSLPDLGL